MKMRPAPALGFLGFLTAAALAAAPCSPSSTSLCLSSGRFEASVSWTDFQGNTGVGQAVSLTPDTGYFWFFTNTNVELVVKVLDGRALDGHYWVFYGALSNVQYRLTVRDSQTGDVEIYDNAPGQFGSKGDTLAFPPPAPPTAAARSTQSRVASPVGRVIDETRVAPSTKHPKAACAAGSTTLCLNGGRFRVEANWKDFQGNTGVGHAVGLTGDTGYFWFFGPTNVEAVVKVLDGRVLNDNYWVFYGALSNVEYTLTVTDTVTGIVKQYKNPSGLFASVGDVAAFGQPTTFQLIDGAVVKGEISAETALVYKLYAFFGDPRVPTAYSGSPPGRLDHGIMRDVADAWPTLSSATQQLLAAYLAPPTYPGSWFASGSTPSEKRVEAALDDWTKIPTARAVVWYRAADAQAETAANNLAAEVENVWTKETNLMQRDPVSDAGAPNNGGDGKLDIYVLPGFRDAPTATAKNDALGIAIPYPPFTSPMAAYILVRGSYAATPEGARDVLAHEFFHTLSDAFTYKNRPNTYRWLDEATATWMEDYVYPTQIGNLEQGYAPHYFNTAFQEALDSPSDNGYAEYLYFFYLARSSAPAVNAQIWSYVASMAPWQAIEAAAPGGLEGTWPAFALDCWDTPQIDQFKQWDQLAPGLSSGNAEPLIEPTSPDGSQTLPSRAVEHLAMSYAYFHTDLDTIKRVEIENQKLTQDSPFAKVQAWIKLADGTTRVEDWTKKDRVVFCRDKATQKITDLLILYTNSTPDPVDPVLVWNEGKVRYDSIGCGYHGTVHATRHDSDGSFDETIDVAATFLHVPESDVGTSVLYGAARYTVRYQGIQRGGSCTYTLGPIEQTFEGAGAAASFIMFDTSKSPPGYYAACGFLMSGTETVVCPDGTIQETGAAGGSWWIMPAGLFQENPDGTLTGTYTDSDSSRTFEWSITPDTGDDGP